MFQVCSSLYLLRGKIHEAMDNRIPAIGDFKMALKLDVYCIEAYELLVRHEMLTPEEGENLKIISKVSNCSYLFYECRAGFTGLGAIRGTVHHL
jgi:hypothetical protein